MTTTIHDKSLLENYQTYPMSSPDQQSGKYTGKVGGILTFSNYKRRTRTEDHQSHTNYQSSISITAGTALTGTRLSSSTSLAIRNYCQTDSEAYREDNLQKTNQDHRPSHLPPHSLGNHSKPERLSPKGFIVYYTEQSATQRCYRPR